VSRFERPIEIEDDDTLTQAGKLHPVGKEADTTSLKYSPVGRWRQESAKEKLFICAPSRIDNYGGRKNYGDRRNTGEGRDPTHLLV
jgi:hypothetical protein